MPAQTLIATLLIASGSACLVVACYLFFQQRRDAIHISQKSVEAAKTEVLSQLAPLLKEAQSVADTFEEQMAEKKLIVSDINDALEKRVSSLTLLLNRADAMVSVKKEPQPAEETRQRITDAKSRILELTQKGADIDTIADRLSLPKGEVALVVNLHTAQTQSERVP